MLGQNMEVVCRIFDTSASCVDNLLAGLAPVGLNQSFILVKHIMRLPLRPSASRISTFIVLPVFLLVACTQIGAGRRHVEPPQVRAQLATSHSPTPTGPEHGISKARTAEDKTKMPRSKEADPGQTPHDAGELLFAVVSDLNGRYGEVTYADGVHESVRWLVEDIQPDLVVSTGDMVAGQRAGLDYEAMWAGFHAAVTLPFARAGIPFAVTPGNHDASAGPGYYQERIHYAQQWRAHRPDVEFVDDRFYPMHYAFKAKGVLFVSLDATMVGPIDAPQRRWLREVLQAHRDARAKVVFGHLPLYPVSQGRETEILRDEKLEQMLNEFDVDMMISGHHHAYYPGRRGALRLVHMACLGSGPRRLLGAEKPSPKGLLLVRVSADDEVTLDAYESAAPLDRAHPKIERATLPESLNQGAWQIWRDDLEPAPMGARP